MMTTSKLYNHIKFNTKIMFNINNVTKSHICFIKYSDILSYLNTYY
jgi:hypothetical protein